VLCLTSNSVTGKPRKLLRCDNLEALGELPSGSVTLAYLDPPFNSGRPYEAIVASSWEPGSEAFRDQWSWSDEAEATAPLLPQLVDAPVAALVTNLLATLGRTDLVAYLVMMAPRLAEVRRVLADDGSLYVHCDPAASHYLKIVLDHTFGVENFRNEIIWRRTHAHSSSRRYGPVHDVILFYSKGSKYVWNKTYASYSQAYIEKHFRSEDEGGRYQLITCTAPGDRTGTRAHYEWHGQIPPPGRHWAWKREQMEAFEHEGRLVHSSNGVPRLKRYVDDGPGVAHQDIWSDINRLDAHSHERVGYETQKPLPLLERIIESSSRPGDTVLDPFCGTGTALVAAERLNRGWIGMDTSLLACSIALARVRPETNLKRVELRGFPEDVATAMRLKRDDPVAFGMWGTSMLATLADRQAFTSTLAAGSGTLQIARRQFEVMSWVPLRARVDRALPRSPKRYGRLAKMGFVLRSSRSEDGLRGWVEEQLGIPLREVEVDELVTAEARTSGVARSVHGT
jgi:DNA modification methylase